ncbi:hypothetical protein [Scandinavium goeteborgense]|uniref:hypothetical protein n=1 Tax=Scandinavium goeteborgense TaxID=1851514 RepID=UPI000F67807A|nr:hypothetical protein [Scandinavium goeteborgense]QKN79848.1 hypothetical protein A8O29_000575 [Scandinavium goeteborgense]
MVIEGATSVTTKEFKVSDVLLPNGNKPISCRSLRLRSLDVIPDGKIGIHSHENRPAILSVVEGEGMQVSAWHRQPVKVGYGESYAELNNIVHYAVNLSKTRQLTLTTFDLLDNGKECNGKTYPQNIPLEGKLKDTHDKFFESAPKGGNDETNHPLYEVPFSKISLPAGAMPLDKRIMRARKVTLQPGVSLPIEDYRDRPSFIYILKGEMNISTSAIGKSILTGDQSMNLINAQSVVIQNLSDNPLEWFVYELVSPDQESN